MQIGEEYFGKLTDESVTEIIARFREQAASTNTRHQTTMVEAMLPIEEVAL
jgi:hypothetical protein